MEDRSVSRCCWRVHMCGNDCISLSSSSASASPISAAKQFTILSVILSPQSDERLGRVITPPDGTSLGYLWQQALVTRPRALCRTQNPGSNHLPQREASDHPRTQFAVTTTLIVRYVGCLTRTGTWSWTTRTQGYRKYSGRGPRSPILGERFRIHSRQAARLVL